MQFRAMFASVLLLSACGSRTPTGQPIDGNPEVSDGATIVDANRNPDASCLSTACQDEELCYDGVDNDCDGDVDDGCGCTVGNTARCLPPGTEPGASICSYGEMTCVGGTEFGNWSECVASTGTPGTSQYGCRRIGIMGAPGANGSSNFQDWLEMQGAIVTRFHAASTATTLQLAELQTYDLVIVDWLQRNYTTDEATTLSDWVKAGGALVTMTGHDSGNTAARHESLLATMGPHYDLPGGPLNGPAVLVAHPTTAGVDGIGTLPPVTFNGGLRVIVPTDLAATIVPIAMIGASVVGAAGPLGEGHIMLFGDEWIEFDSEWSTMPAVPTLWSNVVQYVAPDESLGLPVCD